MGGVGAVGEGGECGGQVQRGGVVPAPRAPAVPAHGGSSSTASRPLAPMQPCCPFLTSMRNRTRPRPTPHDPALTLLTNPCPFYTPTHTLHCTPAPLHCTLQVRELELNMDLASVSNLLDFLEKV